MAVHPPGAGRDARRGTKVLGACMAVTALAVLGAVQGSPAAHASAASAAQAPSQSGTVPVLAASAASVTQGSPVTITYSTPPRMESTNNEIAFFASGQAPADGSNSILYPELGTTRSLWAYTQTGTQTLPAAGSAPVADGAVTFGTTSLVPGKYTVYLLFQCTTAQDACQDPSATDAVAGAPITVTVTPASGPDIHASAPAVPQGQNVAISYTVPADEVSPATEVAWYGPNRVVGISAANTSQPAPGTSGTLTFSTAALPAGIPYTVYLLGSDGTAVGAPVTVKVMPAPADTGTLTPSKASVTAGDDVSFGYTVPSGVVSSGNTLEWLPAGASPLQPPLYAFNQAAAAASGTDTFGTTGLASGRYDVYLLSAGKSVIAGPVTITVKDNGPQLPSPGQLPGQPNLIVNGGAEMGSDRPGSATLTGTQTTAVPGWSIHGTINQVQYGAAGGYPAYTSPGSADRGQNFFAAARGGTSTATQTISLAKAQSQISGGNVKFNLGGWLGGTGTSTDNATVTATFRAADGTSLGTATLGPVTPAMRANTTGLLPENAAGNLPRQTSSVKITLTVAGPSGQGYADNLSFTISSDAVTAPAPPAMAAPDTPAPGPQTGNPNLIVNGNAETGVAVANPWPATTDPGWTVTSGWGVNEIKYGIPGFISASDPGPADRGQNLFAAGAGGSTPSTITQTIDVSKAASAINQDNVSYDLSGWLGGAATTGTAALTATFLDGNGNPVGTATLGPVTPATRGNTQELLSEDATGTLPAHTVRVEIALTLSQTTFEPSSGQDAYADNLSFTISSGKVPAPPLPAQPKSQVPRFDHVFLVMMENEDQDKVVGNTAQAPYFNSLLSQGGNLTNDHGLDHPSDENYTALAAGTMSHQYANTQDSQNPVQQIGDLVSNAGGTWRSYMQSANGPCDRGSQYTYTIDDTPFTNFQDLYNNPAACQDHEQPLAQLAADLKSTATTPAFSWLSANDCYDIEACGIPAGDEFLQETLPEIFHSPAWTQQRSLLIIVWDEATPDADNTNHITDLFLGSQGTVKPGSTSAQRYTHYSMTRTIEAALNLPSLTADDYYADPVSGIWTGK